MTQPPQQDVYLEYRKSPAGIREVARYQRILILCILGGFLVYGGLLVAQRGLPLAVLFVLWLFLLGIQITSLIFVFLLTTKLYGVGIGILLGILTLIPCIGLITLLAVNSRATAVLKAAGVTVGFLGAKVPENL